MTVPSSVLLKPVGSCMDIEILPRLDAGSKSYRHLRIDAPLHRSGLNVQIRRFRLEVLPVDDILPDQGHLDSGERFPGDPEIGLDVAGNVIRGDHVDVAADGVDLEVLEQVERKASVDLVHGISLCGPGSGPGSLAVGFEVQMRSKEGIGKMQTDSFVHLPQARQLDSVGVSVKQVVHREGDE